MSKEYVRIHLLGDKDLILAVTAKKELDLFGVGDNQKNTISSKIENVDYSSFVSASCYSLVLDASHNLYRSQHHFIKNSHIIGVIVDVTKKDFKAYLTTYLNEANYPIRFSSNEPKIIVIADEFNVSPSSPRTISEEDIKELVFQYNHEFIAINHKTGKNIDTLFEALAGQAIYDIFQDRNQYFDFDFSSFVSTHSSNKKLSNSRAFDTGVAMQQLAQTGKLPEELIKRLITEAELLSASTKQAFSKGYNAAGNIFNNPRYFNLNYDQVVKTATTFGLKENPLTGKGIKDILKETITSRLDKEESKNWKNNIRYRDVEQLAKKIPDERGIEFLTTIRKENLIPSSTEERKVAFSHNRQKKGFRDMANKSGQEKQ
jgi:hypothetical protein